MSDRQRAEMVGRRGELLAELFLQELGAQFVARPTADLGYDFFVGFNNADGGVNVAAVEVKATERPVQHRYPVQKQLFRRLAHSNIPVVLLVANVKENRLFYALPGSYEPGDDTGANTVHVDLTPVNESTKDELRSFLSTPQPTASGVLQ